MDGFGAAITGSTGYNLIQMTQENRTKFLTETFSDKEGYGFSLSLIHIYLMNGVLHRRDAHYPHPVPICQGILQADRKSVV